MKKLLTKFGTFMFLISTMFICTACPPDNDPDKVSASPSSVSIDPNGGSQTITITSNTNWVVSPSESWCNVTPNSGSNDGSITISAGENYGDGQRSCILTIMAGDAQTAVSITQSAVNVELSVSGWDANFSANKGTIETAQELSITCNTNWEITGKPDWLEIDALSGVGNKSVKAWVKDANTGTTERKATLRISAKNKSVEKIVTQSAGRSSAYLRAKEYVTLTNSLAFGYDYSNNASTAYSRFFNTSNVRDWTDADILYNLSNYTKEWTLIKSSEFNIVFGLSGCSPNTSYTLITVALEGDNIGEITRKEFVTPKEDLYISPYIDNTNISVSYDQVNSQSVYRIKVEKDSKNAVYANKFYSWAIAGTEDFLTLHCNEAQLAYCIKSEIARNSSPHDTYINGDDTYKVRERLEGPVASANYTLPANRSGDKYLQIVNWCTLENGNFSGRLTVGFLNLTNGARQLKPSVPNAPNAQMQLTKFSQEELHNIFKIVPLQ